MEGGMVSERERGKEEREGENWRRGHKSNCFPLKKDVQNTTSYSKCSLEITYTQNILY